MKQARREQHGAQQLHSVASAQPGRRDRSATCRNRPRRRSSRPEPVGAHVRDLPPSPSPNRRSDPRPRASVASCVSACAYSRRANSGFTARSIETHVLEQLALGGRPAADSVSTAPDTSPGALRRMFAMRLFAPRGSPLPAARGTLAARAGARRCRAATACALASTASNISVVTARPASPSRYELRRRSMR